MSWDKHTRLNEKIETTIEVLKELKVPYKLTVLGEVADNSIEVMYCKEVPIKIRKLEYKDSVLIEQMIRNEDCDFDDCVICKRFLKSKLPKKWKVERWE